jgi:hypothetical protein
MLKFALKATVAEDVLRGLRTVLEQLASAEAATTTPAIADEPLKAKRE